MPPFGSFAERSLVPEEALFDVAEGIANAVRLARRAADEQMVEKTAAALADAGVLRSAPAASFARSHD